MHHIEIMKKIEDGVLIANDSGKQCNDMLQRHTRLSFEKPIKSVGEDENEKQNEK